VILRIVNDDLVLILLDRKLRLRHHVSDELFIVSM